MPDRDYSHRDVVDKLGIKPGHAVAVADESGGRLGVAADLLARVRAKVGRELAREDEPLDVALLSVDERSNWVEVLARWKARMEPTGGVWLLTPKRGLPGYVDQNRLIEAGQQAGLVDNKVCSVSEHLSAMRFVLRKADRPRR